MQRDSAADVAGDDLKRRRAERKMEMARERNRRMRAKAREMCGALSRKEHLANSWTATKPWEALGISRRTWERRKAADKAAKLVASTDTPPPIGKRHATCDTWVADISERLAA